MAYKCPRCGKDVKRGSSTAAAVAGGMVGSMIAMAFGPLQCASCGPIPRSEFSAEDQSKIQTGSIALIGGAVLVAIVAILLIIFIIRM